jgi:hypothetical protein
MFSRRPCSRHCEHWNLRHKSADPLAGRRLPPLRLSPEPCRRTPGIGRPTIGRSPHGVGRPIASSRRFSSAVEQRFCKPKVGSSILSTGTSLCSQSLTASRRNQAPPLAFSSHEDSGRAAQPGHAGGTNAFYRRYRHWCGLDAAPSRCQETAPPCRPDAGPHGRPAVRAQHQPARAVAIFRFARRYRHRRYPAPNPGRPASGP